MTDKLVMAGDDMLFYYGENKTVNNEPGSPAIGAAKTKRDRLIGVCSKPDTLGRVLTRPFKGAELDAPIRWGNKRLNDLKGKVGRLRFQLDTATLYSFDVR